MYMRCNGKQHRQMFGITLQLLRNSFFLGQGLCEGCVCRWGICSLSITTHCCLTPCEIHIWCFTTVGVTRLYQVLPSVHHIANTESVYWLLERLALFSSSQEQQDPGDESNCAGRDMMLLAKVLKHLRYNLGYRNSLILWII